MPLPEFDDKGDLPPGIHRATFEDVTALFGSGSERRQLLTARLRHVHGLVAATGKLERFLLFGSYITGKAEPNDFDIVLVMRDDMPLASYDEETQAVFDHRLAAERFGASVFWTTPAGLLLVGDPEEFLAAWGTKRDLARRGVVEVIP
jgi:hypothetical protein